MPPKKPSAVPPVPGKPNIPVPPPLPVSSSAPAIPPQPYSKSALDRDAGYNSEEDDPPPDYHHATWRRRDRLGIPDAKECKNQRASAAGWARSERPDIKDPGYFVRKGEHAFIQPQDNGQCAAICAFFQAHGAWDCYPPK